jgi:hypothetical protein
MSASENETEPIEEAQQDTQPGTQPGTQQETVAAPQAPAGGVPPSAPALANEPPQRRSAALAWVALSIAVVGFILAVIPFATWGSGIFILAGLILSIVALVKVRTAKGASIAALILSVLAIPATIVMTFLSVGLLATASYSLDNFLIEQQITSGIFDQLEITATVTCPDVMMGGIGSTFECEAVDMNGDSVIVDVTVTDSAGGVSWEIRN